MATFQRQEFIQDPSEYLDYKFDWSKWLPVGDTVSTATVTVSPGITADQISTSPTGVFFWLAGGVSGRKYDVTVNITTTQGRTAERSVFLKVMDL